MRIIDEHVEQLVAHLRFPLEHRKRTRSTNLLERTFVEWTVPGSAETGFSAFPLLI